MELEKYIYEEIIPRYSSFDDAHKEDHALTVIAQSMKLMKGREVWLQAQKSPDAIWLEEIRADVLLAAAAYHDLGLVNGRDRHHLDSGSIVRRDAMLRTWFGDAEIELIAQAAEDHRASGKGEPRSIYGMIVAEADRLIDADTIIRRTIQFGFKHYPGLRREEHIARTIEHLREKYGRGGYLKLWIPWSDNAVRLAELQDLIDDPEGLRARVESLIQGFY